MKGFAIGMILIAIYVAVQPGTAAKAEQAGGLFGGAVRRLMSPGVAGVPQRGGKTSSSGGKPGSSSGGKTSDFPSVPDLGYSGGTHDAWGRPL